MESYIFIFISMLVVSHCIFQSSKAEFYTSIADLEKLVNSVEKIVNTLDEYQRREEERLTKVKWLTDQFEKLQKPANEDAETFLANPVNAYLLVKRLTTDWDVTTQILKNTDSRALIQDISPDKMAIPSKDDLNGASSALLRLQSTFLLDAADLAKGKVKGTTSSAELSAGDCYELGLRSLSESGYNDSLNWFKESMNRLQNEEHRSANEIDVLEYLAYSHYLLKNYSASVEITERILYLDPAHPRAGDNLFNYKKAEEAFQATQRAGITKSNIDYQIEWPKEYLPLSLVDAYEKLCRGESMKTPEEESKLYCYTTNNKNSYLLLQPIKVEVLNLNPRIVMCYDVLKETEADDLKALTLPLLNRATVDRADGVNEVASYRISKSAWLYDSYGPVIKKLNRRIGDISGLDIKYAEPLHAINYGIGGHYEPHIDYAEEGDIVSYLSTLGNRLATWIFYLSHVPAGGSTVFPTIGVEIKPIKGAAAFWYNLYQNGTGNSDTRHAACPVLTGSKWVANKWLHENGNEFRRPCSCNQFE